MTKVKTYQQLKDELDALLAELQHEDTDIDKAITLHEQADTIVKQLKAYLGEVSSAAQKEK